MTDPTPAPHVVADRIERRYGRDNLSVEFRILVDHARATSPAPEGGDLAEAIRREAEKLDPRHDHYSRAGAATVVDRVRLELYRIASRVEAPAPSVATPPQEGEDGALGIAQRVRERVTSLDVRDQVDDLIAAPREALPAEGEERRPLGELAGRLTKLTAALLERDEHELAQETQSIRAGIRAHRCDGVRARFP